MSELPVKTCHSLETMRLLKSAALPTHVENFVLPDEISRRGLLKWVTAASAALAVGLPGCARKPERKIVSRVGGPEYQKPGKPLHYASTWTEGPCPYGLLIKTVDGRPIKIDGNSDHPLNQGTSTAAMQASLLSLYDPDRPRSPRFDGQDVTWDEADRRIIGALRSASSVVLLTRATLGPAQRALLDKFKEVCPQVRHFVHESVHDRPRRMAWRQIYQSDGEWLPRFDRARVILSLECDFLGTDGAVLEHTRHFTQGRALDDANHEHAEMSRLYVAEGAFTLTGSNADHRIRMRPSGLSTLASALHAAVKGDDAKLGEFAQEHQLDQRLLAELAEDLAAHRGEALVVAGGHLPEPVHAAVALLNDELDAPGHTLEWNPSPATSLVSDPSEVEAALASGVDVLICLGANPVYDWPGGQFRALLEKARISIGHGPYLDETCSACSLALPSHHNLESWNDAEPRPGLKSLCQPVIAPLFDTRQEAESLLVWTQGLAGESDSIQTITDWHDYLKQLWQPSLPIAEANDPGRSAERAWEDVLRTGGLFNMSASSVPALDRDAAQRLVDPSAAVDGYELVVLPHHAVYDGRFAGNGWLQELPDPVSKLVWSNTVSISPGTAARLGVAEGDVVAVTAGARTIELPALIQPGMAEGVLATTLGYGRSAGGPVLATAGGANAAQLLGQVHPATPRFAVGVQTRRTGDSSLLVRTQKEFDMHGRPIVLDGNLHDYRREADFVKHQRHLPEEADLYEPYDYSKGPKWAMAIDLGACTGCGACMTACQAENNIPIVGPEQCQRGREMHWLRIDRYLEGDPDNPKVHHQPMLCQHCDHAPCENVCPVNATTHSPEGLNEMVYNRCVGTRYCANNCPYKVRRFNFLRFQEAQLRDPVQELAFNPQVTVRGIGVMEKCSFCVQRINAAKFKAAGEGVPLADGAAQTACQEACPAQAIVFGDLNDPDSRIANLRKSGRAFHVLEELNVKPNVTYLARVRNPNASSPAGRDQQSGGHQT